MTGMTPDQTTTQAFLERTALHPDRVAMREKHLGVWNEITWRAYLEHVEDFCLGLISLGLEQGDKACIHGENTQEWMYADLAIQSAGGVSVGIYPTNPAAEVKYIAGHCDAKIYVAQDQEQADKIIQVKDSLPNLKKIVVWNMRGIWSYDEPLLISFKEVEELGRRLKEKQPGLFMEKVNSGRPGDDALIIYTSGTTGPPKGAVHTHRSFLTGAKGMADFFDLREDDHFLSYLPLCHAAERLFSVYMPLFCGAVISFAESTQTVQRDLVDVSPSVLALMPRILEKMRAGIKVKIDESTLLKRQLYKLFLAWGYEIAGKEMKNKPLSLFWKIRKLAAYYGLFRPLQDKQGLLRARRAVCGGAAVGPDLVRFFRAIGVPITQIYGQTEGLIIFAPAADDIKTDTVGKDPFEGVTWMLSEDNEILWKWGGVFKGYYKDEAVTKETIDEDGWLHSGDIGQLDEDGHLKIVDRKKNIIITSGGKNITPEYIENKLKSSPYIADAIIIGEARPFLTALIQIDFDVVSHWAETRKLAYTTLRDLSRNQAVLDLVSGIVTEVNKTLARVEEIKKFRLIDIELDHETGELTATMKVKRNVIDKKFGAEIEKMYKRRVKK